MSFKVVARDRLKPECREEALKLIAELIAKTRQEPGNISYVYCKDTKDPDYYAMIEEWKDQEALEAHMQSLFLVRMSSQRQEEQRENLQRKKKKSRS